PSLLPRSLPSTEASRRSSLAFRLALASSFNRKPFRLRLRFFLQQKASWSSSSSSTEESCLSSLASWASIASIASIPRSSAEDFADLAVDLVAEEGLALDLGVADDGLEIAPLDQQGELAEVHL